MNNILEHTVSLEQKILPCIIIILQVILYLLKVKKKKNLDPWSYVQLPLCYWFLTV